ncbi:uncharacterized protein EV422DRAFT_534591 [Fimicolochytrium jonesii]|uniref:uncharacterized protein n=1 Tax=Fimicolochytrium jonesii TaxID=1396493 RepID=UPI0022FE2A4C|nr:uncharacterized protein EV422DRAFT_534591 [Fimicolochytrium jonesii]KAI8819401.1 hypothetical protein EV422DRAFT_534591 [Fimicolochytrium jonesii]
MSHPADRPIPGEPAYRASPTPPLLLPSSHVEFDKMPSSDSISYRADEEDNDDDGDSEIEDNEDHGEDGNTELSNRTTHGEDALNIPSQSSRAASAEVRFSLEQRLLGRQQQQELEQTAVVQQAVRKLSKMAASGSIGDMKAADMAEQTETPTADPIIAVEGKNAFAPSAMDALLDREETASSGSESVWDGHPTDSDGDLSHEPSRVSSRTASAASARPGSSRRKKPRPTHTRLLAHVGSQRGMQLTSRDGEESDHTVDPRRIVRPRRPGPPSSSTSSSQPATASQSPKSVSVATLHPSTADVPEKAESTQNGRTPLRTSTKGNDGKRPPTVAARTKKWWKDGAMICCPVSQPVQPSYLGMDVKRYPVLDYVRPFLVEERTKKERQFQMSMLARATNPWSEVSGRELLATFMNGSSHHKKAEPTPIPTHPYLRIPTRTPTTSKTHPQHTARPTSATTPSRPSTAAPNRTKPTSPYASTTLHRPNQATLAPAPSLTNHRLRGPLPSTRPQYKLGYVPTMRFRPKVKKADPGLWERLSTPKTVVVRREGGGRSERMGSNGKTVVSPGVGGPMSAKASRTPSKSSLAPPPLTADVSLEPGTNHASGSPAAEAETQDAFSPRPSRTSSSARPPKTSVLKGKYSQEIEHRESNLATVEDGSFDALRGMVLTEAG